MKIEDYGIIGDTHTVALVGKDGSIDWLCLPRFDSDPCFAKLLGDSTNGYWKIAPQGDIKEVHRSWAGDSLVLQTDWVSETGSVRVIDCMPIRETHPEVVRLVEGVSGTVPMRMELVMRFGFGSVVPWVHRQDGLLTAIAGPDALSLWTEVRTKGKDFTTVSEFNVSAGQRVPFILSWYPSHELPPRPVDAYYVVKDTEMWWNEWAALCGYQGKWRDFVIRSLITLKALTYAPTGGIVAAATTSLPEVIGGSRNWDYRFCWLRDATLTLASLMRAGYYDEAIAWRDWLLRAVAGDPSKLQIMYGPSGERRLEEWTVDWLSGYEGSKPVRAGNAASNQYQLDVYGEVMSTLHEARVAGIKVDDPAWALQQTMMDFIETGWKQPDEGIWEVRGPRRHFTHSKVMAWVAVDRAVKAVEECHLDGPLAKWKELRAQIHSEVSTQGWNPTKGAFTQYYGSDELDASLLMIPMVGFLPPNDYRVKSTVKAIMAELTQDGFVMRYKTQGDGGTNGEASGAVDGLQGGEGAFLACSFWLVDNLDLMGRRAEATALFDRLMQLPNELGLLSEEYDPVAKRLVGNFPQAFSHVSLVNSAYNLTYARSRGGLVRSYSSLRHKRGVLVRENK
ncbi:MAG: glycoside hydrolase family 15 protein [Actinobacteria bacterium]|nr:glycoside hydrolase family 15 protein [Actinomycetota bacterium]MCL6105587.1 glycoside hydrolase family 15 protein [Actinomycetota bacterium]